MTKSPIRILFAGAVLALLMTTPGLCAELPAAGDSLGDVTLPAPKGAEERAALGIGEGGSFRLTDVDAELVLFEFFGVYCPICHEQAPDFNRLVKSLGRDPATKDAVKVIALAAGATDMELEFARKEMKAKYPMLNDPDFTVHKKLGEPKTPFTLLLKPDGSVLWAHLGRIGDPGELFTLIKSKL